VLYPEPSKYLFFRTSAKNDGSHDFSETFQEHQKAGDGGIIP
jgi:cell division protein YceG involved in septum cleavage